MAEVSQKIGWGSRVAQALTGKLVKLVPLAGTPLYRNAYALMVNTVGTAGLGLLYWVIAARLYSPEAVGRNAAIISAMVFLADIGQLNLMSVMVRFIPRAGRLTARLVGVAYLTAVAVTSALSALVVVLGIRSPLLGLEATGPAFNLWFILATVITCISLLQDSVLNGLRESIWVPIENITHSIAKIVLVTIIAATFPRHGIFASWAIPVAAIALPLNILIFTRLIPRHVRATQDQGEPIVPRKIFTYLTGNYIGTLLSQSIVRLLPLIVVARLGASANAYFYLPWIIVLALKLISANMTTSLTVEGARDQQSFAVQGYHFLLHMARLYIPVILVFLVAAPLLLQLSGGSYAAEGTTLLRLLALSSLPNLVSAFYIGVARVQQRVAGIVLVQGVTAGLALGLSYLLLPVYHIAGVGIAILISETVVALLCLVPIARLMAGRNKAL